jgi:hypothetical protein
MQMPMLKALYEIVDDLGLDICIEYRKCEVLVDIYGTDPSLLAADTRIYEYAVNRLALERQWQRQKGNVIDQ